MKLTQSAALAAMALALAACKEQAPAHVDIRPVKTVVAQASSVALGANYSGEIRARHEVKLGFRVPGKIAQRLVEVGQAVKPGQALLRLDGTDAGLQIAATRSQYEQARLDHERAQQLLSKGFVSQAEVDRRKSQLDALQAQYRLVANQGGYTTLLADRAGVVTAIDAEVGQVVQAGQPVARLAQDGEREVVIAVPESRVSELKEAQQLKVTLWANAGKTYQGKLRELSPDTDPVTRTYAARVVLLDADEAVRLGMTANVSLAAAKSETAVRLPLTAIYDQQGQPQVWLVDSKTQTVSLHKVKLSGAMNDEVLVSGGLRGGELVVTAGVNLLHAGQRVKLLTAK